MTVWIGLAILAVISVLLGKVIFEPEHEAVQAATRPVLRNLIWPLAILTSAALGLATQMQGLDAVTRWPLLLASVGFIAFAMVCLTRTMMRWRSATTP